MHHTLAILAAWMPHQRWFTAATRAPQLRLLAERELLAATARARVRILVVADDAPRRTVVYQIPIVERAEAPAPGAMGVIGTTDDAWLVDGPHDLAFTDALLAQVSPDTIPTPGTVLRGEQSNTSIIYRPRTGTPIICKIFRQLSAGINPDVELQRALADAGSRYVAAAVGSLEGQWADPATTGLQTGGTLAFAQEFFPDVEDAWRVALRAAENGEDFSEAAAALGHATAAVHLDLARLFPAPQADDRARAAIAESWRRRLEIATAEVPPLAPYRDAIRTRYAAAARTPWPSMQRIHGDYHLGQVLRVAGRGWVLLDFEGEPMRPMPERREPDLALRDIAGMLRSFDYVAGSLAASHDGTASARIGDPSPWSQAARAAFLTGYRSASGIDPAGLLLDALELEKAVYEAIYETRHRPAWLTIPLGAIERLLSC